MQLYRAIVHSPPGGAGNHLRWLLLLDPEFIIFDGGVVKDKVSYILENVYPTTRNRYNWFEFEVRYRQLFNDQIKFAHTDLGPGWQNRQGQFDSNFNYFCYPSDSAFALECYRQLGSTLLKIDLEILHTIERDKIQVKEYLKNYSGLSVDSNRFFVPDLDELLYNEICDYGKFRKCYNDANTIHKAWWTARNNASRVRATYKPVLCPYLINEIT